MKRALLNLHPIKKAIIAGVSKLPVAMSSAFKEGHIQAAFRATGHIDTEGIMPSVKNLELTAVLSTKITVCIIRMILLKPIMMKFM